MKKTLLFPILAAFIATTLMHAAPARNARGGGALTQIQAPQPLKLKLAQKKLAQSQAPSKVLHARFLQAPQPKPQPLKALVASKRLTG